MGSKHSINLAHKTMADPVTIQDIYALFKASQARREASQEAFDRHMAESKAEFDRRMAESKAEDDRRAAEAAQRSAEADRRAAEAAQRME
jgi:hypothetical protein